MAEAAAVAVVREYWRRMQSNDFAYAAQILSGDFRLEWPQSNERLRGRENFTRMNSEYPAHGRWEFTVHRIVGDELAAVSDVSITDGVQRARAITFSSVAGGLITSQTEFWPEDYPAPQNRRHLVEPIQP
ncbi:nuclear transport factor 2 family protein [Chitinimonas sp.]|uniref:nuclear transport factor 2 family protein n=1 Tax=Chitinimonas sp. TaxID=1934313 RepID=UPI002F91D65D